MLTMATLHGHTHYGYTVQVLSAAPWWPAGWPPRGGPAERADPRGPQFVVKRLSGPSSGPFGGALALSAHEARAASGEVVAPQQLWAAYARDRPGVAPTPAAEAAAAIVRNAPKLARDALAYAKPPLGSEERRHLPTLTQPQPEPNPNPNPTPTRTQPQP
jgi:hypothetical protein